MERPLASLFFTYYLFLLVGKIISSICEFFCHALSSENKVKSTAVLAALLDCT